MSIHGAVDSFGGKNLPLTNHDINDYHNFYSHQDEIVNCLSQCPMGISMSKINELKSVIKETAETEVKKNNGRTLTKSL